MAWGASMSAPAWANSAIACSSCFLIACSSSLMADGPTLSIRFGELSTQPRRSAPVLSSCAVATTPAFDLGDVPRQADKRIVPLEDVALHSVNLNSPI